MKEVPEGFEWTGWLKSVPQSEDVKMYSAFSDSRKEIYQSDAPVKITIEKLKTAFEKPKCWRDDCTNVVNNPHEAVYCKKHQSEAVAAEKGHSINADGTCNLERV